MIHRTIAIGTLLAYSFWVAGCTSTVRETVIQDELSAGTTNKISEITLDTGTILLFDESGGHFTQKVSGQTTRTYIIGYTWDKKIVEVDIENVLGAKIERTETDAGRTTVLILVGIPAVMFGVILIAFLISPPHF
ncbi:MAG: hypothetical protein Q8L88_00190 [Bacteroidota bacterium]|nr:hypothetical protein [Bacteroidota bacterium]